MHSFWEGVQRKMARCNRGSQGLHRLPADVDERGNHREHSSRSVSDGATRQSPQRNFICRCCNEGRLLCPGNRILPLWVRSPSVKAHKGHLANTPFPLAPCTTASYPRRPISVSLCVSLGLRHEFRQLVQLFCTQITRELILRMLLDAARGILHLHSEHVIHRDISARNMLVAKV